MIKMEGKEEWDEQKEVFFFNTELYSQFIYFEY